MIKAIFFDMDGVIVDTEKDGHRVAFNKAFRSFGIDTEWDVSQYHKLLQIAGGKERMKYFFQNEGRDFIPDKTSLDDLIIKLHKKKTEFFISLIENKQLPLRPGIKRIMKQANQNDIKIAICTTSNEKAANAIINNLLNDIKIDFILAGDIVKHKKPDPEIYLLALDKTGLKPKEAIVIEDSENGLKAAKGAGLKVVVTVNDYTRSENLEDADIIISTFGDNSTKTEIISSELHLKNLEKIDLEDIMQLSKI